MQERIRNFCIIAHIDHGKSTLADRLLEITHSVPERKFRDLMLDDMDLERERGITIKASTATMYHRKGGVEYQLNLIDTPGHVDFGYEVTRALRACEGAILLVDANQGVQAQTVANLRHARSSNLTIVPAVTKIDLPTARPVQTMEEMEEALGIDPDEIFAISGKTGQHVEGLIDAVIEKVPPPAGDATGPLRALVFDSHYDDYRGVIIYVRVFDGKVSRGDKIVMMGSGVGYEVSEVGVFAPVMTASESLSCGQVGYLIAGMKNIRDVRCGDTMTLGREPAVSRLAGYEEPKPMVFCGFFPQDSGAFPALRTALAKLSLNDSSFVFEPESSEALGFGFRCGFLGLLHMEIVRERLERENDLALIQTAANVTYEAVMTSGERVRIDRPSQVPDTQQIGQMREPWTEVSIILPTEYLGNVTKLIEGRRGVYRKTEFLSDSRAILQYELPLAEIIYDFYGKLKSLTRGYGTMDYEVLGMRESDLVKVDVHVGGSPVDALSVICHRDQAESRGRKIITTLRKKIDRHLFAIALQAAVGSRVIARENIPPVKKKVTAKCYGGDVTRKRKLLEKQKEGKKRMKAVGKVQISQEAFLSVLEGVD